MCIKETAFLKYIKDYVKDIEAIVMRERKREEREGERRREEGMKGKSEDEIQATNKTMEEESGRKWKSVDFL